MIVDSIKNAEMYNGFGENLKKAMGFIQRYKYTSGDFITGHKKKIEIDSCGSYAIFVNYMSKMQNECVWEAHQKFIDVHFVVDGEEKMGYSNITYMKVQKQYNEADDAALFTGTGDYFTITAGQFTIFMPDDVHMTSVAINGPEPVSKIILKVAY